MRVRMTYSVLISVAALGFTGCGAFTDGVSDTALIPPSANYQASYVPLQPPMMQGLGGNMLNDIPQTRRVNDGIPMDAPEIPAPTPAPAPAPTPAPTPNLQMSNPQSIASEMADPMIPNSPILTPSNTIELNAVGMGVAPETSASPSQALALAKRAAIVDAYRQIGEKMYGIRVNGQDTVKDMMLQNSVVKTKVQALIRNAEITETVYKDGLCQVSMELKLDGKVWHRVLSGNF
ncbi:LPP20 family lipoprotein [Helicobacter enhydrae]|uniref:LPP20 family lipoprotein n=1 Tax=Helicobacter enhydrae TaxID=222136 RepID=UPI000AB128D8|nr:hypothetical protein [Helicobacter enhydrae]